MTDTEILRYAAFTDAPEGGNPAGVVPDATGLDNAMLAIAAEVGYSETAFLLPTAERGVFDVRYFSPVAEVPLYRARHDRRGGRAGGPGCAE